VFPVRYELNLYVLFRRNSVFKGVTLSLKVPRAVRQESVVMGPVGFGTKNHCAGEGQQQFNSQSVFKGLNNHLDDFETWFYKRLL
jgi:hypothetical protein